MDKQNDNDDGDVYDFDVSANDSLKENVRRLFSPSSWWKIWTTLRTVVVWFFIIMLVRAWALFVFNAKDENAVSQAKLNFVYMLYWALLLFWATWILWSSALNIEWVQWSQEFIGNFKDNLLFQVVWFMKAMAFFLAVVMIAWFGFRIISANEKEEKLSNARKWVINVLVALMFIKIIDYIYYIAQQTDFKSRAQELVVGISKVMGFILWFTLVLLVFYAWVKMVLWWWEEDSWTQAKETIRTVFLVTLILFLFLLIAHQVISEVAF